MDGASDAPDDVSALDAEDEGEASTCGAPWVLFGLTIDTEGGVGQVQEIYARRADGTDGHALSLPISQVNNPSVSPDGTELLYTNGSLNRLFLYRFADASNRQLDTQGGVGGGAVSPDGSTVVFGTGQDLYLIEVDADAAPEQSLVVTKQPNAAGSPVFTADSRRVLFSESGVIQSVRVDGLHTKTLLSEASGQFPQPTLSPDYKELAAIVSCSGPRELRVYPYASLPAACASGKVVAVLSGDFNGPSWGPTGLIAFSGEQDVFIVSAAGGKPINLTADLTGHGSMASGPTWAPACTRLP